MAKNWPNQQEQQHRSAAANQSIGWILCLVCKAQQTNYMYITHTHIHIYTYTRTPKCVQALQIAHNRTNHRWINITGAYHHIAESMHTLNDMTSHEEMTIGHPYEETPDYTLHPSSNGHSNYTDQHDFYLSSNVILDSKFQTQYSPHKLYSNRGSQFYSGKFLAWLLHEKPYDDDCISTI